MKKQLIIVVFAILFLNVAYSQTNDKKQVKATLNNYIEGTSYNKLKLLVSAFATNATLYLKDKDGNSLKLTPEEYAGFFKGKKEGEFNGRVGKILGTDIVNDIATAKVEIYITKTKKRYIDLFLLKKDEAVGWKIISKTATIDE